MGERLFGGIAHLLEQYETPCTINHVGSIGSMFFTPNPVTDYASAKTSDTEAFARYFRFMLDCGFALAPSQFEAMFISAAHDDAVLDETLDAIEAFLKM